MKKPSILVSDTGKSVTVRQVGGGWIFEWRDPTAADAYDESQRNSAMGWPYRASRPAISGTEIFTDAKALIKRLSDFIA